MQGDWTIIIVIIIIIIIIVLIIVIIIIMIIVIIIVILVTMIMIMIMIIIIISGRWTVLFLRLYFVSFFFGIILLSGQSGSTESTLKSFLSAFCKRSQISILCDNYVLPCSFSI